jgi:hypothetical protein
LRRSVFCPGNLQKRENLVWSLIPSCEHEETCYRLRLSLYMLKKKTALFSGCGVRWFKAVICYPKNKIKIKLKRYSHEIKPITRLFYWVDPEF